MFWDKIASMYDFFENTYNRKVYTGTGKKVAELIDASDSVLECACGTGAITVSLAPKCKELIATDFSDGMLKQVEKKCREFKNVTIRKADITHLEFGDASFDKAVAGNVIHLLSDPNAALKEMERVVKPGGKLIIPTYINMTKASSGFVAKLIGKMGADFKRQFDLQSYQQFFADLGYTNVEYNVVEGKMPCAIAVITTEN